MIHPHILRKYEPDDFDLRGWWTISEVMDATPSVHRRKVRRWLEKAGVLVKNAAGVKIVSRTRLEGGFPELLECLRRQHEASLRARGLG